MNYRHAYHAGNFADVVKHAVLCRVLAHLRQKPGAFRVIDTHAGAGVYDLAGPEAGKTGEWRDGIGRLIGDGVAPALPAEARALLAPYLDAVAALNPPGRLNDLSRLARARAGHAAAAGPADRLRARAAGRRGARPPAARRSPRQGAGDRRLDRARRLRAAKERRGLVLVDPPFEQPDEFARLAHGLATAHRKWPTGIYLLWYPIKDAAAAAAFVRKLARLAHRENVAGGTDRRNGF